MRTVSIVAAVILLSTSAHAANLLVNGSFDAEHLVGGCVHSVTTIPGWTVKVGNIDIESSVLNCSQVAAPASGKHWIDLTGTAAATIEQTVATTIGKHYRLTFYFGGNSEWQPTCTFGGGLNDASLKSMSVYINGSVPIIANYSINTAGQPCTTANWTFEGLVFTATSAATTITFQSFDTTGVYGPLLDGVVLTLF